MRSLKQKCIYKLKMNKPKNNKNFPKKNQQMKEIIIKRRGTKTSVPIRFAPKIAKKRGKPPNCSPNAEWKTPIKESDWGTGRSGKKRSMGESRQNENRNENNMLV